jgi:UDP-arabinose 4-epimerase
MRIALPDRLPILVTGGAGYIGSHVCKALAEAGHVPITYDNFVSGHRWTVKWGPLEEGDIQDGRRLNAVLESYRPRAVIHLAAYAYVGESVEHPGKYYRNNVAGSLTLLEALRDQRIDNIIFSSSCSTYGVPHKIPITEDHKVDPINPYGSSKVMVEQIIKDFGHAHGIRSVILRYFNAAGADPGGELGEEHCPETHLIPLLIKAGLGHLPDVQVYGTDYDTPDGTAIRDYIHVTDLADAHLRALMYLVRGENNIGSNAVFNLGTGRGYSVREIIAAMETSTGRSLPVRAGPRRSGDPAVLVADYTRALRHLGWTPRLSSLENIISTAWHWYVKQAPPASGSCGAPSSIA